MKKITVICVFNKNYLLESLLQSFDTYLLKTYQIQYLLIDNTKNKYNSAANAFNSVIDLIDNSIVIFTHQDIVLLSSKFIDESFNHLLKKPNSIIGLAGAINSQIFSNMTHGLSKVKAGKPLQNELVVQTVDEVFFITSIQVINKIRFDEHTCNGWHLYATDLCLSASNNKTLSIVLPSSSEVYHKSSGKLDLNFYFTLKKIIKKHRFIKEISTTCVNIKNNFYYRFMYVNLKIIQFILLILFKNEKKLT